MGFQQGLSGLNAASVQLDTIGNNIANANTVGFKSSRTEFADLYGRSLYGLSATTPGLGVQVAAVTQNMTGGNLDTTGRSLDLAINNSGFFIMGQTDGTLAYTRNGQFQVNSQGYIVNNAGNFLQGWTADNAGNVAQGPVGKLQLTNTSIPPTPTSKLNMAVQLDSTKTPPVDAPVNNPADPKSYTWSNNQTIYDSLGNSHQLTLYYSTGNPTAAGNTWSVSAYVDGAAVSAPNPNTFNLSFNTSGVLTNNAPVALTFTPAALNGAAVPQTVTVDFTHSTQIAQTSGTLSATQDGAAPGTLTGISIGSTGLIQATFSNSQTKTIGQVALATFPNPQGLQDIGGNMWQQTGNSGGPTNNAPGSGNTGTIASGQVEDSNVNLTNELVNMITAQRYYQANAQTVKTQDTLIQTLLNI
ncbi:flagellar hook protein FlgE [Chromobacterium alticapitis]|uniref:Flagellar hook protein FlgE n=1 Tax=Chromobacterium alticapitis TaxID=2073169 RepID=A0A2S5DCQ7_9NEIS|nr:flagellar hook protein FlgE [Chromobacterium alticapitis]POZ60829.1 flagellar hook protein FlgE [Chromobacterium alticapitis]